MTMATITEDYCDFETAKLLKEKGFNGTCWSWYHNGNHTITGTSRYCNNELDKYDYSKPTHQMAMKWLREVHNIVIVVTSSMFWGKYNVSIYKKGNDYPYGFDGGDLVPSYEQACEAAIKYCLENLI